MRRDLTNRTSLGLIGAAAVCAAVVSACSSSTGGKGDGPPAGGGTSSAGASSSGSSSSAIVPLPPPLAVNKTVWFAGMTITVGTVTAEASGGSGEASEGYVAHVAVTLENLSEKSQDGFPSSNADLSYHDTHLQPESTSDQGSEVPGKTKAKARLDYSIPSGFDVSQATLTIGGADYQQSRIPFGAGTLVDHKPVDIPFTGQIRAAPATLTISSAQIRADDPDGKDEAKAGHLYLVLYFKGRHDTGPTIYIGYDDLSVKLPDGSGSAGQDGYGTTDPTDARRVYIPIPDPVPAGKWTLTYTYAYDPASKGSIPLTVPASAASAGTPASVSGSASATVTPS